MIFDISSTIIWHENIWILLVIILQVLWFVVSIQVMGDILFQLEVNGNKNEIISSSKFMDFPEFYQ